MQLTDADKSLHHAIQSTFQIERTGLVAVAVSGGGDSVALLHLMQELFAKTGVSLRAVTVDHGLREASAGEALAVGVMCKALGVEHSVLKWQDWDGSGNLQDEARRARYGLMADWARDHGVNTIALGHTADDQAETFLMRLSREAGIDGLAGMAASRQLNGIDWLRPLLSVRRGELRAYLRRKGVSWVDDPSNEDERFDRIKARKILQVLEPMGIDADVLSGVTKHLSNVRQAISIQSEQAARTLIKIDRGDVQFDRKKYDALPHEIGRRLLNHAIKWVASAEYGPRGRALAEIREAIAEGRDVTLHGCRVLAEKNSFRVVRELNAVKDMRCPAGEVWDNRWKVFGDVSTSYEIAPLGETGLNFCDAWRETGLPRASLIASPAVWRVDELVAAPIAGLSNEWVAELTNDENHFFLTLLSH